MPAFSSRGRRSHIHRGNGSLDRAAAPDPSMPIILPPPSQMADVLDEAWARAERTSLQAFDAYVENLRATGAWIPDDVDALKTRLAHRDLVLIEAVWLTIPEADRGDYWTFQEEYLRRENALIGGRGDTGTPASRMPPNA